MNNLTDEDLIKELERRIKRNSQDFAELQELNSQLQLLNGKLEESEKMKTNFLSNIRNEIINPFASILGLSNTIIEMKDMNFDKVKSLSQLIYSEAFNLDFQLKNIFTAAEIEAGEAQPEFLLVDISQSLEGVIQSVVHEASKKTISIILNDQTNHRFFVTDPEKLQLILLNLISNAIEYSHDQNSVIVLSSIEDNKLKVVVQDFGAGIETEDQLVIFDRFKRLNSEIHCQNQGQGLGLTVTKALLDMLKGEVSVRSKKNEGSTFTVTIPEASETSYGGHSTNGNEFFFKEEIF